MNNFESHELATQLTDTYSAYKLARLLVTFANRVEQIDKPEDVLEAIKRELSNQN